MDSAITTKEPITNLRWIHQSPVPKKTSNLRFSILRSFNRLATQVVWVFSTVQIVETLRCSNWEAVQTAMANSMRNGKTGRKRTTWCSKCFWTVQETKDPIFWRAQKVTGAERVETSKWRSTTLPAVDIQELLSDKCLALQILWSSASSISTNRTDRTIESVVEATTGSLETLIRDFLEQAWTLWTLVCLPDQLLSSIYAVSNRNSRPPHSRCSSIPWQEDNKWQINSTIPNLWCRMLILPAHYRDFPTKDHSRCSNSRQCRTMKKKSLLMQKWVIDQAIVFR